MQKTAEEYRVTHHLGTVLQLTLWAATLCAFWLFANSNRSSSAVSTAANQMFKSTVDIGLESRIVIDTQCVIRLCSPTAANICGRTPDELIDKPFLTIIAHNFQPECKKVLEETIHDDPPGQVHISRWDVRKKDGTERTVEVIVRAVDSPTMGRLAVVTLTPIEAIQVAPPMK